MFSADSEDLNHLTIENHFDLTCILDLPCRWPVNCFFFLPEALGKEFTFFLSFSLTPRELWADCAGTSAWDWRYWCARWPATAARARPRRLRRLRPRAAGTRNGTWGGWWRSLNTWRRAGVATARKRKPRRRRVRGALRRNRRFYAAPKQTERKRLSVSGGLASGRGPCVGSQRML